MKRLSALLAGASGLVGSECLRALLECPEYERVLVVTRRDLGAAVRRDKVRQLVVDFTALEGVGTQLVADHVFCALGTTIGKAGSRARFREVDYDYPRRLAEITRRNGARVFALVSAVGAHPSAPFFYSRVKGELEESLRRMGWPSLVILRPSVIGGERGESRPFERLAQSALRFAPAQWRPVAAATIAEAMVRLALRAPAGVTTVESRNIATAARSNDQRSSRRTRGTRSRP